MLKIDSFDQEIKPAVNDDAEMNNGYQLLPADNVPMVDEYLDEINCDFCTLLNPISASRCSACYSPLPQRK